MNKLKPVSIAPTHLWQNSFDLASSPALSILSLKTNSLVSWRFAPSSTTLLFVPTLLRNVAA